MCKVIYSIYTFIKAAYYNRLNAQAGMKFQLSSIKLDIEENFLNVQQGPSPHYILNFRIYSYFLFKMAFM